MGKAAWLSRALILLVILGLGWHLPTLFFDDAYITFRYAANLAHGDGLTWNPPERVLGITTPLFALLLGLSARAGADIETAALVLGLAGHALLCLAVFEAVPLLLPGGVPPRSAVRLLAAMACALHPHLAFTAVGGMETPLYCALIVATLAASARGWAVAAGAALGLALLARPDAVLLLPPAVWLLAGASAGPARPRLARAAVAAAAVAVPWILFASYYYGSPVPHSIAAKRLIHPCDYVQVLADFGRFLRDDWFLMAAVPLALWAVPRTRRPLARGMALFALLYFGAVTVGGVEPFAWYVNPLIPVVLTLGAVGLVDILSSVGASASWVPAVAVMVAAGGAVYDIRRQIPDLREQWDAWEGTYEMAARWIMTDSKPGDRVLVGETGVIGYLLPGRYVIDSSGINSPDVYRARLGGDETDPEWSRRVVRDLKPDYITTSVDYLNIRTLSQESWFDALYEDVTPPLVKREGQVIYRRRRGA